MKVKLVNTEKILRYLQMKIRENHDQATDGGQETDPKNMNKTQTMYMGKYIAYEEIIDFMKEVFESNRL